MEPNPLGATPFPARAGPYVPKAVLQAPPTWASVAMLGLVLGVAWWMIIERRSAHEALENKVAEAQVRSAVQPAMLGNTELAPATTGQ